MFRLHSAASIALFLLLCTINSNIWHVYAQGGMDGSCDEGTLIQGCTGFESDCQGNNRCTSCSNGLVLVGDKSGNQECKQCKTGVKNCIMCTDDAKRCLLCKEGYRLFTNKKGIQKCKKCKASVGENCFMCTENLKKCEKCFIGFFELGKDGKCYSTETPSDGATDTVKYCVESTGSLCSRCKDGYKLITEENGVMQKCKKCKTGVKNCSECTADRKTCTWCSEGYTFQNGSCKKS
jgi:hypothetical protein